jgi:hypothetical protein
MQDRLGKTAILVTSSPGGITRGELEAKAATGERPRKDYVELARLLDADVIDAQHMELRAATLPRLLARKAHFRSGQLAEAFLGGRYRTIVAWGDYLGLSMASLLKATRSRRNLFIVAYNACGRPHRILLDHLKVHTHLSAVFYQSSVQMECAMTQRRVPRHKLHRVFHPVDERFWMPVQSPMDNMICAAGLEARDYGTLLRAVEGLPVNLNLALASTRLSGSAAMQASGLFGRELPANVRVMAPSLMELRSLYAASRFVVVPLVEVQQDAGATVVTEAMAMGKAVILTRTQGQVDLVRHGEHGLYVPPRDPAALRAAIEHLLAHPEEAERMGRAGRALIEARHRMDTYVGLLARTVQGMDAEQPSLVDERV